MQSIIEHDTCYGSPRVIAATNEPGDFAPDVNGGVHVPAVTLVVATDEDRPTSIVLNVHVPNRGEAEVYLTKNEATQVWQQLGELLEEVR